MIDSPKAPAVSNADLTIERELSGPMAMGSDSANLELAESGRPGFRLYTWEGPWVTLGRFQEPEDDLLPGAPVKWVKRPTGGKAVLHGHDLTIGLAYPLAMLRQDDSRSVRGIYRRAIQPIIGALQHCGIDAGLTEDVREELRTESSDCFGQVSANDIVSLVTLKKVCGCALRLTRKAVLVQASIPVGPPLVDPALVYREPAESGFLALGLEELAGALHAALSPP